MKSAIFSKADRKNYFVKARGSIFECVAILDILKDEKNITEREFERYALNAEELSRMLFTMIRNLEV